MTEPIRLAKQLAAQLGCSRREAEEYIAGGWVEIDGLSDPILGNTIAATSAIVTVTKQNWIKTTSRKSCFRSKDG